MSGNSFFKDQVFCSNTSKILLLHRQVATVAVKALLPCGELPLILCRKDGKWLAVLYLCNECNVTFVIILISFCKYRGTLNLSESPIFFKMYVLDFYK